MDLIIYYKGKAMGTLKGDTFKFDNMDAELNEYLNSLFQVKEEEDDEGNIIFVKEKPTTMTKIAGLNELGYELKEAPMDGKKQ